MAGHRENKIMRMFIKKEKIMRMSGGRLSGWWHVSQKYLTIASFFLFLFSKSWDVTRFIVLGAICMCYRRLLGLIHVLCIFDQYFFLYVI